MSLQDACGKFQPICYSCGHGWRQLSSSHSFPFLWRRDLTAPAQEVPEGARGCVCFPFEGPPPWSPGPQTKTPGPTSLPPCRKEILQRGQCPGTRGDLFTCFHLVTTCILSPLSLYLVICSRTAKWPGHLISNGFMPFPSSLLAALHLYNLPLGF